VHQVARVLDAAPGEPPATVRRRFDGLLGAMRRHRAKAGSLAEAIDHFLKVTRSYRPGLFHCYGVADLPRTNNALEQLFGSYRRHERRATGRKTNSSATVLRGPVRIIAAIASQLHRYDASDLAGADRAGGRCVPASIAATMPACCALGSAVIPRLTSANSSSCCASRLCRSRKNEPGWVG
jgi:hypothetical protein